MALTISSSLPKVSLAGNAMLLQVNTDNLFDGEDRRPFYTIILNVYDELNNLIKDFSQEPDDDGNAWFDLQEAFSTLKPTLSHPIDEDIIVEEDVNAVSKFYFKLSEGYGVPYVEQSEGAASDFYYAIPGGLPEWYLKELDESESNFYLELVKQNIWLTNQPKNKKVFDNQPEQLRFFNILETSETVNLLCETLDSTGAVTTSTLWSGTVEPFKMYSFLTTKEFVGDCYSYKIWLDYDGQQLTEPLLFVNEKLAPEFLKFILFQNSLGGFDCLPINARFANEHEVSQNSFYELVTSVQRESLILKQNRGTAKKVLRGSIGLLTNDEIEWSLELVLSEEKYIILDDILTNITMNFDKVPSGGDSNAPKTCDLEIIISLIEKFFRRKPKKPIPFNNTLTTVKNGYLYNYFAISDSKGIAKNGWEIPSKADWESLLAYIGNYPGQKLKESGTTYWDSSPYPGTNNYNFNGRGSGYRGTGGFVAIKLWGIFFTNTLFDSTHAYYLQLEASSRYAPIQYDLNFVHGMSIRLIRRNPVIVSGESGIYIGNDGKVYRTININGIEWLADNLCETKYKDGSEIPNVTLDAEWNALTTGARCVYNNDELNM